MTYNRLQRYYYSDSIVTYCHKREEEILGEIVKHSLFDISEMQRNAWIAEISILKSALVVYPHGQIYFEYSIPRLGRRIDVVVFIQSIIFVLEFKVGENEFDSSSIDQVYDYALDLKNFHESSRNQPVVPILIATLADPVESPIAYPAPHDSVFHPIRCNAKGLAKVFSQILEVVSAPMLSSHVWDSGRYCPTPTIIEAATALYKGHSVTEISRSDASAINLTHTSDALSQIIHDSRTHSRKTICFVTGVPGAGKTLVGLNIATKHIDKKSDLHSVFLSGNGPLVDILREALARDKVRSERERGVRLKKFMAMSEVKMFIQNVHHFRDECLVDKLRPPIEHVALFDEAQRAWNKEQTVSFMLRKKKVVDFSMSEPHFLISCLDRHPDWAVIVCLVGGGQEINTGEAGIGEWISSIVDYFPHWCIAISSRIDDSEYDSQRIHTFLNSRRNVTMRDDLHLSVSLRAFRSENVSLLVKQLLDIEMDMAKKTLREIGSKYKIVLTRDVKRAKAWLKLQARGSERYGIVVSSQAQRLKPHAMDVKSPIDPVHWFLDGKEDVRSSYFLEDVATEFHVQGLELDWACVTWDGDFRYTDSGWQHWSFCGDRWNRMHKPERQVYLKNSYRVLLTRARQGMVIVIPEGDQEDPTRKPEYYDTTFNYLKSIGFELLF